MTKQWTHKVVKQLRGMNGQYFDFPTAATFASESEARAYAEQFARDQAGVGGVRIDVRRRGGRKGAGVTVATYRGEDFLPDNAA